jgi:hypothetical protein
VAGVRHGNVLSPAVSPHGHLRCVDNDLGDDVVGDGPTHETTAPEGRDRSRLPGSGLSVTSMPHTGSRPVVRTDGQRSTRCESTGCPFRGADRRGRRRAPEERRSPRHTPTPGIGTSRGRDTGPPPATGSDLRHRDAQRAARAPPLKRSAAATTPTSLLRARSRSVGLVGSHSSSMNPRSSSTRTPTVMFSTR